MTTTGDPSFLVIPSWNELTLEQQETAVQLAKAVMGLYPWTVTHGTIEALQQLAKEIVG